MPCRLGARGELVFPPRIVADLFPADFLKQLEGLHLLARQISRGRMRAERRSVKQGAGLEFADYRQFSPGDDIRAIDWNVYARNRHLLLKLFEEEEDLHVHLLLDCTASMTWGSPQKFDPARQIVAGLAYLALANLDRAGVALIGPHAQTPWSPSRGRARFLRLLRHLESCTVGTGRCELAETVGRWLASRPRRGLVIWVTDAWGIDPEDAFNALDRLRYARHDIGVVQIRHRDEGEAGELGEYEYEEVETGEVKAMIVDRGVAAAYREAVAAYEERLREYCRRHGVAHLRADAAEPAVDVLRRSLLEGGFVG
ncbi:MAG: hypothetical protein BGO12_18905 [Verrucomicrobia bacterium 61-8]|nr:MAG: hypothetical protein BGO12_18905 [Verrucomicrobia bacterium 61-8]